MQLAREISSEQLPHRRRTLSRNDSSEPLIESLHIDRDQLEAMDDDELSERLETILLERIHSGDQLAVFQLAQLYFELVGLCQILSKYEHLIESRT
jgi:hypothetical protein